MHIHVHLCYSLSLCVCIYIYIFLYEVMQDFCDQQKWGHKQGWSPLQIPMCQNAVQQLPSLQASPTTRHGRCAASTCYRAYLSTRSHEIGAYLVSRSTTKAQGPDLTCKPNTEPQGKCINSGGMRGLEASASNQINETPLDQWSNEGFCIVTSEGNVDTSIQTHSFSGILNLRPL